MGTYLKNFIKNIRFKKTPQVIQLRFLERLSILLREGYSMIDALEITKWDAQMIYIADEIIFLLKGAYSLDEALTEVGFHSTITNYLFFVRENGDMQTNLEKCIAMYEDRLLYIKKFQNISRYPLVLLFIFSILLYFIKSSVLPSFIDLFQSSTEASQSIVLFISLIEYGVMSIIILLISIFIIFVVWSYYKRNLKISKQLKLYNNIPIFRNFLLLQVSFQFSMYLSTMLKSGISFKDILESMSLQEKQPIIAYYATLMITDLSNGVPVSLLLLQLDFLDNRLASIFRKNADMEALERDLSVYADLLLSEIQRKTTKILMFIQPVIFIVLGCFIVFIYATLMLPMYQLIKTI